MSTYSDIIWMFDDEISSIKWSIELIQNICTMHQFSKAHKANYICPQNCCIWIKTPFKVSRTLHQWAASSNLWSPYYMKHKCDYQTKTCTFAVCSENRNTRVMIQNRLHKSIIYVIEYLLDTLNRFFHNKNPSKCPRKAPQLYVCFQYSISKIMKSAAF